MPVAYQRNLVDARGIVITLSDMNRKTSRLSVSLPHRLNRWARKQAVSRHAGSISAYIHGLILADVEETANFDRHMQARLIAKDEKRRYRAAADTIKNSCKPRRKGAA